MTKLDLTTVRIQSKDLKRIDSKRSKVYNMVEPRWSVIERALNKLEKEVREK